MIDTQISATSATNPAVSSAMHTCVHEPCCPTADAADHHAAHVVSAHPEQGWSLLCNGVVAFEDFGELMPDGQSVASRRAALILASPHRRAG